MDNVRTWDSVMYNSHMLRKLSHKFHLGDEPQVWTRVSDLDTHTHTIANQFSLSWIICRWPSRTAIVSGPKYSLLLTYIKLYGFPIPVIGLIRRYCRPAESVTIFIILVNDTITTKNLRYPMDQITVLLPNSQLHISFIF